MEKNAKVEETIEVSLPITGNSTSSISHSNPVNDEWFCVGLNTLETHEERSDHQIKFEAPDSKFTITSGSDDIYIKLEPLESEELQIKDEIDESPTDGTLEKPIQFEYCDCTHFSLEMEKNATVEDTIKVSLPITGDCTSSISHSNQANDEWLCADLNTRETHEERSDPQIKFEAPDTKFTITSGSDDIYIKLEPLENEELQIKDEIDESLTDGTLEKSIQFKYFNCAVCNSRFPYKTNLRQHLKIHKGEKPLKCGICDYSCLEYRKLSRHFKTHTAEKPFKCGSCAYKCKQKSDLSRHVKTHMGDKPFKCRICDYRCIQKADLAKHIKMHMIDKQFTCSVCDYRYTQMSHLSRHIQTHTGENPFKCDSCDYRCKDKKSPSRHIQTCTGNKPFNCNVCDYRSTRKGDLSKHIKTHTGEKPFKCSGCDYRCIEKSSLSRHIKLHMGEKPFKCGICDFQCILKCNLIQHRNTHVSKNLCKCNEQSL